MARLNYCFRELVKLSKKNDIGKYLELISFFTTKIIIMKNKEIILNIANLPFII